MSEVSERACERCERSEAERCGGSEQSERFERTNVASDQVALSKRDCPDWKQAQMRVFLQNGFCGGTRISERCYVRM